MWDRGAGIANAAVIAGWLLFSAGRPTRRTLAVAALSLAISLATVGAYIEWRQAASGLSGLTTNNAWNLYGRVGPWADCTKFTPPPGTAALCEARPPSLRGYRSGGNDYIYNTESPAQKLFGPPYRVSKYPHAMALLQKWSRPRSSASRWTTCTPSGWTRSAWSTPTTPPTATCRPTNWSRSCCTGPTITAARTSSSNSGSTCSIHTTPRLIAATSAPFVEWERITRLDGAWMVLLLALCLSGPWLAVRGTRSPTALFSLTALVLLFLPILTKGYDYRFVIPAYGPLVAAGTLAAWGVAVRVRARLRVRRDGPPGSTDR